MLKLLLFIVIFVIAIPFLLIFCNYFSVKFDPDKVVATKAQIIITDSSNRPIDSKCLFRYVPYDKISSNVINAFVALEDKRFFTHHGVDYYRTAGAFIHNLSSGRLKEGGSTITQQLAKNTMLSSEKTFKRKIKEMKLARKIEKNYSKEQIIEMYLNAIYYGNGIYGIDSAAYNYFGKEAADLSAAEGAILAGIVKNPSRYSPKNNPDAAIGRRNIVLRLMLEQGYIDKNYYETALLQEYSAPLLKSDPYKPYFSSVLHEAASILGIAEQELIRSPYVIRTYCDVDNTKTLYSAFDGDAYGCLDESSGITAPYSAMLCDNVSGGITAFYSTSEGNVFSFRRSPASAIKPILVYAPAIEYGLITEKTVFNDAKTSFNGYMPKNFGDIYSGKVTAETALAKSINTVAVQILNLTEPERAKLLAEKAGLRFDKSDKHLALALGGMAYGVTMTELTEAYMTLANGGQHLPATFIKEILTADGRVLYRHLPERTQAFSSDTAYIVTDMLRKTVSNGTAKRLSGLPFEIAAKTGTAENDNGNTDAWNVSYTTSDTLCVWYGGNDLLTTGGNHPTLLANYIRNRLPAPKQTEFSMPITVSPCEIDGFALKNNGVILLSNPHTPKTHREKGYFSIKNTPKEISTYFDIANLEFSVTKTGNDICTDIRFDTPCRYKLIEKNLMTGQITEYENIPSKLSLNYKHKGLYSYFLAVYYENEFLGYSQNKLVFI